MYYTGKKLEEKGLMCYDCGMSKRIKHFFNLDLLDESWQEWQNEMTEVLSREKLTLIMTPNPEQIMLAQKDERFLKLLQQADILLPDGYGLVWASKVRERLTGSDSVKEILKIAQKKQLKILLIGGNYQANEKGELMIPNEMDQSAIFYTKGYVNISKIDQNEEKEVKLLISHIKPDIIFLAFGAPKQEQWLIDHKNFLQTEKVKLAMVVGGSFDFLLNKIKRAPLLWQKLRLEWLWRLIQEPKRIKRQLTLPQFAFLVMTNQIK